ncbi:SAM-dependent methyltransferase [Embleya hyalina]|uniref:SAM-dependent methyltransferase n=1 Tax=Embleya hyalina TaxID=516124 RepID=A0A401YEU8_9ACTN|nr:SAM-dependent methyltransferase [Embleya hyalina]GCD93110.1 SAM-dependent methyltransferase [Embleya hyalina]
MTHQDAPAVAGIDVAVPSVARVYDYLLGGKDNFASDREVGDRLLAIAPDTTRTAPIHREFLVRGVRYLAGIGVTQFVDLGSGLPTADNTHQAAHAVDPRCSVVYVDHDPIVLAHGRAILADHPRTAVVQADFRSPDDVVSAPGFERLIDLSKPVAWLMLSVVHHLGDEENPNALVEEYKSRMTPGSHLFLSHFLRRPGDERIDRLEAVMQESLGSGRFRTQDEIEKYFDGMEMVHPGVVSTALWRPTAPVAPGDLETSHILISGGMAQKT